MIKGSRLFGVAYAVVTLLYVFVTPPFEAHDERNHFNKAFQYSQGQFFNLRQGERLGNYMPAYVNELAEKSFPPEQVNILPRYHLDDLNRAWTRSYSSETQFATFSLIANYAPSLYAMQTAGITLARLAGLPPLGQFYAARLFNAVASVAMILAAIALMPAGRPAMMAFAALPMVSYQVGSCTPDAGIISIAFLALALVLRQAARARPGPGALVLLPLAGLLALAKAVYVPLLLAGISLRPRRWHFLLIALCLAISAATVVLWGVLNQGNIIRQSFIDRTTLQHTLSALPGEQLAYIARHPIAFAQTLLSSIAERAPVYVVQGIGQFGWFSVLLPVPLYLLAIATPVLGLLLPAASNHLLPGTTRMLLGALFAGGCLLIEMALYISASPLGGSHVEGTQGRYFLPYLPLLGLALAMPRSANSALARLVARIFVPALIVQIVAGLLVDLTAFWEIGWR